MVSFIGLFCKRTYNFEEMKSKIVSNTPLFFLEIYWINESSVNPKSTSNQSSKPCTVLQYPSRKERPRRTLDTHQEKKHRNACPCFCFYILKSVSVSLSLSKSVCACHRCVCRWQPVTCHCQHTYTVSTHTLSTHIHCQHTYTVSTHTLSAHIHCQHTNTVSTHTLSAHLHCQHT